MAGFNYRKRLQVLPGLYINLSKQGASTTIGRGGASVNFGRQGSHLNLSIPGSGFYRRIPLKTINSCEQQNVEYYSRENHEVLPIREGISMAYANGTEEIIEFVKKSLLDVIEKRNMWRAVIADAKRQCVTSRNAAFLSKVLIHGFFNKEPQEQYQRDYIRLQEAKEALNNLSVITITPNPKQLTKSREAYQAVLESFGSILKSFSAVAHADSVNEIISSSSYSYDERKAARTAATHGLDLRKANLGICSYEGLMCEGTAMHFMSQAGYSFYLYPLFFIVASNTTEAFEVFNYSKLALEWGGTRFQEAGFRAPRDARQIDRTWQYTNIDGSPDRRRTENREIPIMLYGSLKLNAESSNHKWEVEYQVSNFDALLDWWELYKVFLSNIQALISIENDQMESKEAIMDNSDSIKQIKQQAKGFRTHNSVEKNDENDAEKCASNHERAMLQSQSASEEVTRLADRITLFEDLVDVNLEWGWPGNPAMCVLDCVLSLNRKYDSVVLPRLRKFHETRPEIVSISDLKTLILSYIDDGEGTFLLKELNTNHADRERIIIELLDYLEPIVEIGDEWDVLFDWAEGCKPSDYLNLQIKGFGIAGFQYLRMLFGAQTVKPDVHIMRFVSETIGREVDEIEAVALLEQAAIQSGLPIREVDNAVWKDSSRKNQ